MTHVRSFTRATSSEHCPPYTCWCLEKQFLLFIITAVTFQTSLRDHIILLGSRFTTCQVEVQRIHDIVRVCLRWGHPPFNCFITNVLHLIPTRLGAGTISAARPGERNSFLFLTKLLS